MFDFEYPKTCMKDGQSDKYCLSVVADKNASKGQMELDAGIRMSDVHVHTRSAELRLTVILNTNQHEALALDFSLHAKGCAMVWQAGTTVSLTVTVCLVANASGHDLFDPATRTFQGTVAVSVTFNIKILTFNLPVGVTIDGVVACAAYPSNNITALGKLGVTVSIPHGGASMGLDFTATTAHHLASEWEFASGISFSAWVNFLFWKPRFNRRFPLWHAGLNHA
ncbi:hypothetical protein Pmar_PMAR018249 [Perkinsus marinus ATCC 50983]|uniref:Uncharacterized protein n=1 Tax=Perkinsus marinus (strain ATCC 50983 / TXsc) TaxID=423536 RepID=C5LXI4_PERM5|nr:hypothetical protein Pmar_PMAR018249 [Perkinsus marinus ATCC 50983]EEQ98559.1 hypothetical protein Pmar_PMAR018249 [Perkinsus marinus ATCC 50983]|eukprot:XP_002765842.1 hypothetical protein Pmar_PMAR018249 [Perkinsus marinus ATCC 50983]